ncbi:glucose-1-phosphate adenylyltransferase [Megamonas sp.]
MRKTECVAMILAGGQGSRLGALTKNIAKPAVPFGGKYRIIDFPLSNCANSGIETVGVLTQYRPLELHTYLSTGEAWNLDRKNGGVYILPPYARDKGADWYRGTADAIYQNINFINKANPKYVLILSGDHIYTMDYSWMLEEHKMKKAQATIGVIKVPMKEASRFGIMSTDKTGRITKFAEKPAQPESNLASMGIYVFDWEFLREYLEEDAKKEDTSHDFGKDIIPKMLADNARLYSYAFEGYWKDVGTIDSLWEANMDLLKDKQPFDMNGKWKIYSVDMAMPPHYVGPKAKVRNSLVSEGAMICGEVRNSVIFPGVRVAKGAKVVNSVIMPFAKIEADAVVDKAIVAQNSKIEANAHVGSDDGSIVVVPEGETVRAVTVAEAKDNVNVG